ncbi:hypothetical protein NNJEOMEG_00618 [Fundidesulfovibrio magnetotacticus]|uniref:DUF1638 domain-containing protein n=1 Tax=Fundidesulfovibrio magnetotacticus TaxID=2730080 RepID=A0A6V8LQF5_9BACT|nr:DUF1638 domain-containing protein [Fundidesulfovibrio magnetotacticus]GFK92791.1 hypothetical protein NNJEOMEG_00618 [Fundidesulfovibrio magnetotacticus]
MKTATAEILLVSCGIFREELARLGPSVMGQARLMFLDSMLHMRPAKLDEILLGLAKNEDRRMALVYGDCCPHMADLTRLPSIRKVRGVNCCDIILGQTMYRQLRREGVFFFLPEWTSRWEEVFRVELGLKDRPLAREFMHEMHTRLMYLDTGLADVPTRTLRDIEAFFDMPVEVRPIGLEHLERGVMDVIRRLG